MDYTLEELEAKAEAQYERLKARLKRGYHLARDLGFSSAEAVVLQGKPENVIRSLARERKRKSAA